MLPYASLDVELMPSVACVYCGLQTSPSCYGCATPYFKQRKQIVRLYQLCEMCWQNDIAEQEAIENGWRFARVSFADKGSVMAEWWGTKCHCGKPAILTKVGNLCFECMKATRHLNKQETQAKLVRKIIENIKEELRNGNQH